MNRKYLDHLSFYGGIRRNLWQLLSVFFFLFSIGSSAQSVSKDYVDGSIYWKVKSDVSLTDANKSIEELGAFCHITKAYRPFVAAHSRILDKIYRIEFSDFEKVDEVIGKLSAMSVTEYAEKVPLNRTFYVPDDTYFSSNQWQLTKINAMRAWDYSKGNPNITVAIIDDAININHPDIIGNAWVNTAEIPGNTIDDDANGYADDINGFDVSDNDNNPNPPDSTWDHGTHVAGIAGATSDNNLGVASIGFGIRIIAIKATKNIGTKGVITHGYEGITYAVAAGAKVINLSWGGAPFSSTSQAVINNAALNGAVIIAAAGNSGSESPVYPAAYANVIAVASTSEEDSLSNFSNYGTWIDLTAPGNSIYSTVPGSDYARNSGTSMSAPLVAGLCGLMLSVDSNLTSAQVEACLKSTAVNIDAINTTYSGKLGAGRINALEAVKCASSYLGLPPQSNFTADITASCTGVIKFTDLSILNPLSRHWDFGDGNSSTLENPVYIYMANGTYTVKLRVNNTNGSDSLIRTNYIVINKLADPLATDTSRCGNGTLSLQATSMNGGTLNWYDTIAGGNLLGSGASFTTPVLTGSKVFFVGEQLISASQNAGPADSTFGAGGYFTNNDNKRLMFDVYSNINLQSVKVYANTAASRTIEVWDGLGNLIKTVTTFIPAGESRVNLNFDLFPGVGYSIKLNGVVDLFRNSKNASYPYSLPGLLSITGVDASSSSTNYFYFYDWIVKKEDCLSNRIPVIATVLFATPVITQNGNLLTSTSGTGYQWYFNGTAIAGATGKTYQATVTGNYTVEVTGNSCVVMSDVLFVTVVGIEEQTQLDVVIYPIPFNTGFTVHGLPQNKTTIEIHNVLGVKVFSVSLESKKNTVNCEDLPSGIYFARINTAGKEIIKRIVKE